MEELKNPLLGSSLCVFPSLLLDFTRVENENIQCRRQNFGSSVLHPLVLYLYSCYMSKENLQMQLGLLNSWL